MPQAIEAIEADADLRAVVVTGAGGQVGRELVGAWGDDDAAYNAGAAGVMVPHVNSAAEAAEIAAAMAYGPGGRGFAGTTRAAGYFGRPMAEHLAEAA
mgnify:CR=1 FL=1